MNITLNAFRSHNVQNTQKQAFFPPLHKETRLLLNEGNLSKKQDLRIRNYKQE